LMNMHKLLASRPNVIASTRVDARRRYATDALGVNGALMLFSFRRRRILLIIQCNQRQMS